MGCCNGKVVSKLQRKLWEKKISRIPECRTFEDECSKRGEECYTSEISPYLYDEWNDEEFECMLFCYVGNG